MIGASSQVRVVAKLSGIVTEGELRTIDLIREAGKTFHVVEYDHLLEHFDGDRKHIFESCYEQSIRVTDEGSSKNLMVAETASPEKEARNHRDTIETELAELGEADAHAEPTFICHCWLDDHKEKAYKLKEYAAYARPAEDETYDEASRRPLRFWIDKFCFNGDPNSTDQDMAKFLACLPIYLMSCSHFVILAGENWLHSLWGCSSYTCLWRWERASTM